jgi:membrane fusion protein (multidrug efflux system)
MVDQSRARVTSASGVVKARQSEAKQAQADVQAAQSKNKPIALAAPVDGVVGSVSAKPGVLVTPAMAVVAIKPVGISVVAFDVTDADAAKLNVGMPVTVQVPNAQKALDGKIRAIPPTGDGGGKRNRVRIGVQDKDNVLKPGSTVVAQVPLRKATVLTVPESAVVTSTRGPAVWIILGGAAHARPIRTAGKTDGLIAVTSGLNKGDVVVVSSSAPLTEGTPVSTGS